MEGKPIPLLGELKQQMEAAAEELDFEKAAQLRDQLQALEKLREKQRMVTQRGDIDVVGIAMEGLMACVQVFSSVPAVCWGVKTFSLKMKVMTPLRL